MVDDRPRKVTRSPSMARPRIGIRSAVGRVEAPAAARIWCVCATLDGTPRCSPGPLVGCVLDAPNGFCCADAINIATWIWCNCAVAGRHPTMLIEASGGLRPRRTKPVAAVCNLGFNDGTSMAGGLRCRRDSSPDDTGRHLFMSDYRRYFVAGGTYFFTLVTHRRRRLLTSDFARKCLRAAIAGARAARPFRIHAMVLLPDHLHALWTLPRADLDYATRWRRIKERFTVEYLAGGGHEARVSISRRNRGERRRVAASLLGAFGQGRGGF